LSDIGMQLKPILDSVMLWGETYKKHQTQPASATKA
jgi:hypothetical protein